MVYSFLRRLVFIVLLLLTIAYFSQCKPQCSVYCQKCNELGQCETCKNPYNLNEKGICRLYPVIQGCRIYSSQPQSQTSLMDSSSQQPTPICLSCQSDSFLLRNKCFRLPQNCQTINQLAQCNKCNDGYELIGRNCLSKRVDNCSRGFFAYRGYCRPYQVFNCERRGEDGTCQVCYSNYTAINGVCLLKSCVSSLSQICKGTIFSNLCLSCKPDNCLESQNGLHCDLCDPSYILLSGLCIRPVKYDDINCNLVDPVTQLCRGCNNDYQLDRNFYCVRNFFVDLDGNVENRKIRDSLFFDCFQGRCYYRDRNCESIDVATFQCVFCAEGYSLRAGKCQKTQKCIRKANNGDCLDCLSQFYLHPLKRTCQQKPPNCLAYSILTSSCIHCKPPTVLSTLSQKGTAICVYPVANCTLFNAEGSCLTCATNFSLRPRSRQCLLQAQFCKIFNIIDRTLCIQCVEGYRLQQYKCYKMVYGCVRYGKGDKEGKGKGACQLCSKDLVQFGGKCIFVDKYCLDVDADGDCQRCTQGLVPVGNKCVYYETFCAFYGADRVCNRTYSGFRIKKNIVNSVKQEYRVFVISSSQTKQKDGALSQIKPKSFENPKGFYTQNGYIHYFPSISIQSTSILQISSNFTAISCMQTHMLVSSTCIKKQLFDKNCLEYSPLTSQCIKCKPSHDMNSLSKCQPRSSLSCTQTSLDKNSKQLQTCAKCNEKQGYFNAGGWCISRRISFKRDAEHFEIIQQKIMWPLLPNCNDQRQIDRCFVCEVGFTQIGGRCVTYQRNCEVYHVLGFCQKCKDGFIFEGSNCVPSNCLNSQLFCSKCSPQFQVISAKCFPVRQPNCLIYSKSECQFCLPKFTLTSQKTCQPLPPNCLAPSPQSPQNCLQCLQLFTLFKNRCIPTIEFCLSYSQTSGCIQCQPGYQLIASSQKCIKIPPRCSKLSSTSLMCSQCQLSYTLIQQNSQKQCVIYRQYCQFYDRTGRCMRCQDGYGLRNGGCYGVGEGCLEADQEGKCGKCRDGFRVQSGACVVADVRCKKYGNGFCVQCQSGFYIGAIGVGFCQPNPQNCQIYNPSQKKCTKCTKDYLQFQNSCTLKSSIFNGCSNQSPNSPVCLSCQPSFTLKSDLCYASNCLTFTADRNCLQCPKYYRKSPTDSRICIPHFCKVYSKGPTCDVYQSNYQGGFLIHASGRIQIEYCLEYDTIFSKCTKCQGYRYPNIALPFYPCYPYNCQSNDEFKCNRCRNGFIKGDKDKNQGTCLASFCQVLEENGTCRVCSTPYMRNYQGICVTNGICLEYELNSLRCRKCHGMYDLNNGECLVKNCADQKLVNGQGCTRCKVGFEKGEKGGCKLKFCQSQLLDSFCKTCAINYRKNLNSGICQPKNCLNYDENSYMCIKCQQNFRQQNGNCKPLNCEQQKNNECIKCSKGYTVNQAGGCQAQFCKIFNVNRTCTDCQSNYLLNSITYLCESQNNFCLETDGKGICTKCRDNYFLTIQKTCVPLVPSCKIYGPSQCQSCFGGFTYKQKLCRPLYCQTASSDPTKCQKCLSSHQLTKTSLCRPRNCQLFSQQSWSCNYCLGRFTLHFAKGICIPKNCIMMSVVQQSICLLCQSQYQLKNGSCLNWNCVSPTSQSCPECLQGWLPNPLQFQSCLSLDCQVFSPSGTCSSCALGKRLRSGLCVSNRCLSFNQYNKFQCQSCDKGYYLSNEGICISIFCNMWDWSGECYQCAVGFELRGSLCVNRFCKQFWRKGDQGQEEGMCKECVDGYYPYKQYCVPQKCTQFGYDPDSGVCGECIFGYEAIDGTCKLQNCQTFNQSVTDFSSCTKCRLGFHLQFDLCLASNCQQFQNSKCISCNPGFALLSDICLATNCLTFTADAECQACQPSFLLQNSTCTRKNCVEDSLQQCLKCEQGFQLFNSFCRPVNCQVISENNSCKKCKQGLVFDGSWCRDINCQIFDGYRCGKCRRGWKLQGNLDKICVLEYRGFCPSGQVYNEGKFMCEKIKIQGCKTAQNGQVNSCIQCLEGYFLYKGLCNSIKACSKANYIDGCTQCFQGMRLVDRVCINPDIFCISKIQGKCSLCKQSYYLSPTKQCIQKPPNCLQVNPNQTCKSCLPSYILSSESKCFKQIANCSSYGNDGACLACRNGFHMRFDNRCYENRKNCVENNLMGHCLKCQNGFELVSGSCVAKREKEKEKQAGSMLSQSNSSENCLHFDSMFQTCLICNMDYYITSKGTCLPMPPKCKFVNMKGECFLCENGYRIISGGCVQQGKQKEDNLRKS